MTAEPCRAGRWSFTANMTVQLGKPNIGLKPPAEEVAREIVRRETDPNIGRRERVAFGVLDPAAFAVISGSSIAETLLRHGVVFRRADNSRPKTLLRGLRGRHSCTRQTDVHSTVQSNKR